ncbi:MAG: peptidylprolyl isomerase [Actinomycetes bacterium]
MGTSAQKHARQKARQNRLDAARASMDRRNRRKRFATVGAAGLVTVVILGTILSMTGNSTPSTSSTTAPTTTEPTTTTSVVLPRPAQGLTLTEPTPCPPAEGSAKRVEKFASAPPMCIDTNKSYTATFETDHGTFSAVLYAAGAPVSVNNFVVLSRYHFYDGVPFHRIVPEFVIQAGDGDGEHWGNNDLGYSIPDELPKSTSDYKDFTLAMANAGPNTNGSQFFVVLPGGASKLDPPNYSIFGEVNEGTDAVEAIGQLANGQSPTEPIIIKTVKITEK